MQKEMDYVEGSGLIFVVASPAGGGYRLGRIISCFNNVYWYSSKGNGQFPWSVVRADSNKPRLSAARVKGRRISKFHFDRRTSLGMIPLLGERIEKFWESKDLDLFYNSRWLSELKSSGGYAILKAGKCLLWVLHDDPNDLLQRFPKAKIIALEDQDLDAVVERYLTTTALFPIDIENPAIKPENKNNFSVSLDELKKLNQTPTYRDYWAWTNYGQPVYDPQYESQYLESVRSIIYNHQLQIANCKDECLKVNWNNLNLEEIKQFIGAESIDENYKLLVQG